jgi:hypothetical protein
MTLPVRSRPGRRVKAQPRNFRLQRVGSPSRYAVPQSRDIIQPFKLWSYHDYAGAVTRWRQARVDSENLYLAANSMELRLPAYVLLSALYFYACPGASINAGVTHRSFTPDLVQRAALRTLVLRGGDGQPGHKVVPGVAWSQQAESVLLKVDMPPGIHSTEGLKISDTHITWKEGDVDLDVGFFAEVKGDSASIFCDGYVCFPLLSHYHTLSDFGFFTSGRQIKIILSKKEKSWWPRLTSGPRPANVKVDWATWKDENEGDGSTLLSRLGIFWAAG